ARRLQASRPATHGHRSGCRRVLQSLRIPQHEGAHPMKYRFDTLEEMAVFFEHRQATAMIASENCASKEARQGFHREASTWAAAATTARNTTRENRKCPPTSASAGFRLGTTSSDPSPSTEPDGFPKISPPPTTAFPGFRSSRLVPPTSPGPRPKPVS